jgi:hypothetical protein
MPNQKISELTAIVTVDNSVDVLPIVDISANTTKKVTPNALKTALALDNVNNTSDANKPVSIAQQDALNAKVTGNTAIVAATKTKITYDAKGLVTAGNVLDAADMPTGINAANIGAGAVSSTEFGYLDGVTSAIQTQLDAKQATLVSATNIKTINSTSLLGAGDISISASPSGVSGAIQFSNGSAFASDAANFFWDDTNNRLGVGTNAPAYPLDVNGAIRANVSTGVNIFGSTTDAKIYLNPTQGAEISFQSFGFSAVGGFNQIGGNTTISSNLFRNGTLDLGARLGIRGSGSTSATTSLLVQNSAGTEYCRIKDDGVINFTTNRVNVQTSLVSAPTTGAELNFNIAGNGPGLSITNQNAQTYRIGQHYASNTLSIGDGGGGTPFFNMTSLGSIGLGTTSPNASALLDITSTTKGVLFPRMTTTQKNAIATPAAGLVVYDSTTNKLCCYNGSTWNDLF